MLVIDDAQYADEGLLDFVDHLLATAQRTVFVVALARPELLARRHDLGGRRTTVVRVDPLDDTAMGRLLDGLVEGLPDATRSALIERAEGVPLFAVETIRALIDRDAVIPRGGRYVPADGVEVDLDAIGAPASLQALIAARLDALSPEERRVVTDASVLGTAFSRDGVAHLDPDGSDLDAILELAGAQGDHRPDHRPVLGGRGPVPVRPGDGPPGRLRHPVPPGPQAAPPRGRGLPLRRTRCRGPGRRDRPAPAGCARRLRGLRSGPRGALPGRARDLLVAGAARAQSLGSHSEAERLLETALARTDPGDGLAVARLHALAAGAAKDAGHYASALHHAHEATMRFDEMGMPIEAGSAAATLAMAMTTTGDNGGALEIALPVGRLSTG